MSDKEESSSAYLPVEGVIGITVGMVMFLLVLITYMYCRVCVRQKRDSVIIMSEKQVARRRGLDQSTRRTGIRSLSWQGEDNDSLRPISGDSNHSFRFDGSSMKVCNQDGHISYDRPYSRQFVPDIVEESENAQVQAQTDFNSTGPVRKIVSNYGPVTMVSTGMYPGSRVSMGPPHLVSSDDSLIAQTNSRTNLIIQTESPLAVSNRQVLSPDRLSYVLYAEPNKVKHSPHRQSQVLCTEQNTVKPSPHRLSHVIYAEPKKVKPSTDRQSHMLYAEPQCQLDRAPMKIPKPSSQGFDLGADHAKHCNNKPQTQNVRYTSEHHDSFRDSQGLDLGADTKKAWMILHNQID